MTRRVLEINDVGLVVANASGNLLTSPGQIICGEGPRDELRVGRAASERRRINPRATHDRFWAALDKAPLPYAAGPARSNADLVWLHLRELLAALDHGEDESWIVVVPAAYDDDQLALLLGIARSLEMRIERMVSAPVTAAAAAAVDAPSLVVDAHWHRFSADRVVVSRGAYWLDPDAAPDSRAAGGRGLGALFDAWANVINDSFVTQTRFDPSHDAVVEQDLHNRLPEWLSRMTQGDDVVAELDVGEHRYRAELSAGALISAAEPFYRVLTERIRQAGAEALVLRHRLAGLPGLEKHIGEAGIANVSWLDEHAALKTALELLPDSDDDADGAVPLTLELEPDSARTDEAAVNADESAGESGDEDPDDVVAPASGPNRAIPSHVLVSGSALAIGATGRALTDHWRIERNADGRAVLAADPDAPAPAPAAINARPAEAGTVLEIGDRIAIGEGGDKGEQEFVLLQVAEGGPE